MKQIYITISILMLLLVTGCFKERTNFICVTKDEKITLKYKIINKSITEVRWILKYDKQDISNIKSFEEYFNKINDYKGCGGEITKEDGYIVKTEEYCSLKETSNKDFLHVVNQDKKYYENDLKTIEEDFLKYNDGAVCN